jgi:thiamine-monophosphate kinase
MKVSELGEFGLIELLSGIVSWKEKPDNLLIGIGDDAAAWRSNGSTFLATTDTLVQGVHFTADIPWRDLGWKAVAVNLSDIAAMGGTPQYALISLSLPGDTEVDDITQLYLGVAEAAGRFQTAIIGGNISSAPLIMINMTVLGQAQDGGILTRSAAVPGDLLAVTGYLGSSAAGMRMLTGHLEFDIETMDFLRNAHLRPQPRISEGQLLVVQGVRAAIDISDGLIADLRHLCESSRVGALIKADQIPIHPLVMAAFREKALPLAISGGEDYELLFTAGEKVLDNLRRSADFPISVIGVISRGEGVILPGAGGKSLNLDREGWDHFG